MWQNLKNIKYLQDRGISVSGLKPSLMEITSAVERMVLPIDPTLKKIKQMMWVH